MAGVRGIAYYGVLAAKAGHKLGDEKKLKEAFAKRLQAFMAARGWNQSEMARRANLHLPTPEKGQTRNREIGRDLISHYVRGKILPNPVYLEALATALAKTPAELLGLPDSPEEAARLDNTPLEMKAVDKNRVFLRINRTVSNGTATKIMQLLQEEDDRN